jgi:hypothetical protein
LQNEDLPQLRAGIEHIQNVDLPKWQVAVEKLSTLGKCGIRTRSDAATALARISISQTLAIALRRNTFTTINYFWWSRPRREPGKNQHHVKEQ